MESMQVEEEQAEQQQQQGPKYGSVKVRPAEPGRSPNLHFSPPCWSWPWKCKLAGQALPGAV